MASRRDDFVVGKREVDSGAPLTTNDNAVTHLLDAQNYFKALRGEIEWLKHASNREVPGKFFHVAGWNATWVSLTSGKVFALEEPSNEALVAKLLFPDKALKPLPGRVWTYKLKADLAVSAFRLDDSAETTHPLFVDELAAMSANDTDVRVLLWCSPFILRYEKAAEGLRWNNLYNLLTAERLRSYAGMRDRIALFTIGHPLGSLHLKTVICGHAGSARAYVGGIDLAAWRLDTQRHLPSNVYHWHDVAVRLAGGSVKGIHDFFRALWKEQHDRDPEVFRIDGRSVVSHLRGASVSSLPGAAFKGAGAATVQVLRTCPVMRIVEDPKVTPPRNQALAGFGSQERLLVGLKGHPWAFAPRGVFEFAGALEKAIGAARSYIYAEDQGFISWEIMSWLRKRIAYNPNVKVILVQRADPADGPDAHDLTTTAINEHLAFAPLPGGRDINTQVAFFARTDAVTIHAKTWIIDDIVMIAGSANAYRRALYTDAELSVSVIDDSESKGALWTNDVVHYRCDLWAEHCGLPSEASTEPKRADLVDIHTAIQVWVKDWRLAGGPPTVKGPAVTLLPVYKRLRLPLPSVKKLPSLEHPDPDKEFLARRDREDPDSRDSV